MMKTIDDVAVEGRRVLVRADLVVLGRHGHPSGPGPGIGSIQHAVLDHAHGPVAVVPSGA